MLILQFIWSFCPELYNNMTYGRNNNRSGSTWRCQIVAPRSGSCLTSNTVNECSHRDFINQFFRSSLHVPLHLTLQILVACVHVKTSNRMSYWLDAHLLRSASRTDSNGSSHHVWCCNRQKVRVHAGSGHWCGEQNMSGLNARGRRSGQLKQQHQSVV